MPLGLYISAEGANAQSKRLEVLSNNLANVDTPGFKRDLAIFQARYSEATQRGMDRPGSRSTNDLSGGVLVKEGKTDFSPGAMRRTGQPTDLAIEGEGFFVVQKGDKNMLTRAGNFMLTNEGQLVTQDGFPVLSDTKNTITIDKEAGPWTVSQDGNIQQAGDTIKLALVKPKSLGDLAKAGDNLFQPLASTDDVPDEDRRVAGGMLEMSGVHPTSEMMELIEASRAFEANANMIRNQDQMIGGLVNRMLKVG